MFCKIFCNLLLLICILATSIYGIEKRSRESDELKAEIEEIKKLLENVFDKNDRAEKVITDLERMQNETISTLESFKKDAGDKVEKLTEDYLDLAKAAFLMENQIMKMTTDLTQLQSQRQPPLQDLKKIEEEATRLSNLLISIENKIARLITDRVNIKSSINKTMDQMTRYMAATISFSLTITNGEISGLKVIIGDLSKSSVQTGKQIAKLTADLQNMKRVKKSTLELFWNDTEGSQKNLRRRTTDPRVSFSQAGSSYVRWGSFSCPSDAELIYNGFVGGSPWQNSGSAVNYLCLPRYPDLIQTSEFKDGAIINGGEYRILNAPQTLMDPLCAVCRIPRSTSVMIPAKSSCSPGWTREYQGFLMAGRWYHAAATEIICVDESLSSIPGSGGDEQGRLLQYTFMNCKRKNCANYRYARVIVCTVCSK